MAEESPPKSRKRIGFLLVAAVCIAVTVFALIFLVVIPSSNKPTATTTLGVANSQAPPYYLQMPGGGNSKILVTSTTSFYGTYPFNSAQPVYSAGASPIPTSVIQKGDPCFIVNITIQNNYSSNNLPPDQPTTSLPDGTTITANYPHVYVYVTAKIYDKQGHSISATDVTPPYGFSYGGAYAFLNNGESGTITIYLATSSHDISRFDIIARYIGSTVLP